MNIIELANQAKGEPAWNGMEWHWEELQKFADLVEAAARADEREVIVKECVQVSEDDITDGDACCTNTADRIARQIKQHFGVEA